jgi:hypothetical protein
MKLSFIFSIGLAFAAIICGQSGTEQAEHAKEPAQTSPCQDAPKEIIEKLWRMAARGELLTLKGRAEASTLFTKPGPPRENKAVRIISDYYAVNPSSVDGAKATVDVGFLDAGEVDANLRYSAPAPMPRMVLHASLTYHLVSKLAYVMVYGPDGKALVEKKEIPGEIIWQVDGPPPPPWVTVNAAIRYVLEMRDNSNDPATRKNADQTLAKLKKLL